jgi:hypothetical protein
MEARGLADKPYRPGYSVESLLTDATDSRDSELKLLARFDDLVDVKVTGEMKILLHKLLKMPTLTLSTLLTLLCALCSFHRMLLFSLRSPCSLYREHRCDESIDFVRSCGRKKGEN